MLKVREVYVENVKYMPEEKAYAQPHKRGKRQFNSRECLLNPDYIVAAYPHSFNSSVELEMLQENFSGEHEFTRVIVDGNSFRSSEIIIEMAYVEIAERLS